MSSLLTKCTQLALATVMLFLDGSFFALAVFSVPVEKASGVPSALNNVWSSAMSLMSIVSIPFMALAGKYLNEGQVPSTSYPLPKGKSKSVRVRVLSVLASACIALLFLVGWGIPRGDPYSVAFAVAMQGAPLNLFFLVPIELLAEWMPRRPGLAVGCGQAAFGLGTMFFSGAFENFMNSVGTINAVYLAVVVTMIPGLLVSCFLKWPSLEQNAPHQTYTELADHAEAERETLSLRGLLLLPLFWQSVFSIIVTQTGFVFISYFFRIGLSFNQSMHSLVQVFEVISFVQAFSRPLTGMLADSLKWGRGFFSLGSKNVMLLAIALQALFFAMLISFSNTYNFSGFTFSAGIIVVVLATSECISALLLRDIFGQQNSSVAFGAGASIGFGVGCFISPLVFTAISSRAESSDPAPSAYNLFYLICVFWSIAGLIATATLSRYGALHSRRSVKEGEVRRGTAGDGSLSNVAASSEDSTLLGASVTDGYGSTKGERDEHWL